MAKGFEKNALRFLRKKKNMRIIDISNIKKIIGKQLRCSTIHFYFKIKTQKYLKEKILNLSRKINLQKIKEIEFAFRVCKFIKSNAIVITKNLSTIGIGAGQQNRLDGCKYIAES